MAEGKRGVAILGIFVADLAFRAGRMPGMGETIIGSGFKMGPGGKGSNQSVAAARVGGAVTFISKVGKDEFAAIASATWRKEGIGAKVIETKDEPTGAAYIYVDDNTGENAIIVVPGAGGTISIADVDAAAEVIRHSAVFVTQLEQPASAAQRGLEIARAAGVITVFNPAPAEKFDEAIYRLCDYVTPNENEATLLTGIEVRTIADARKAGDVFLDKGVGTALITLGEAGGLLHSKAGSTHIPAFKAGQVVETTGAGDAFNGGFAAAYADPGTTAFQQFLAGTGSMLSWWGDVGSMARTSDTSVIGNIVNFSILPGSDDVYNAKTGKWDKLPSGPNFAPNMAYIGWGVYVMARVDSDEKKKKAAWSAAAHLGGKDISLWMAAYPSGFQPYRNSHFNIPEWVVAGYDEAYISSYLNSNRDSYNHPNAAIEPRIPGIFQYYSVAEDELQKTFAGQNDAQTGANNIAAAWEKLTDQIGRDNQIKLYKASLGM
jgi:ribokinase